MNGTQDTSKYPELQQALSDFREYRKVENERIGKERQSLIDYRNRAMFPLSTGTRLPEDIDNSFESFAKFIERGRP